MKFTEFVSEIVKSFWAWIGLFMDIIGAIVYKSPDMANKLSFANMVQQYWWVWIVIGTLLIIWGAWEAAKKMVKDNKNKSDSPIQKFEVKSKNQRNGITAGYIGSVNYPEDKKKELAYKMGITLNIFQQHIKDVANAYDENMFGKLKVAHEEFYELRDGFLSNGKAVLDNSIDVENAFKSLNGEYCLYADGLKKYLYLIEINPFANKQPSMDEIKNHPYFVEKIGLGVSLRTGELFRNLNKEIEDLRRLIKENL